jgi:hypothetical protein
LKGFGGRANLEYNAQAERGHHIPIDFSYISAGVFEDTCRVFLSHKKDCYGQLCAQVSVPSVAKLLGFSEEFGEQ